MSKHTTNVDDFLNLLNSKIKLSDFIGQYVSLTEKGNSFVGRCPFHDEKTPSFNVNNDKGLFYCFGCKTGGNIISFVNKYKNYSFKETINFLSDYSGIQLSNFNKSKELNDGEQLNYRILEICNIYFKNCLIKNSQAYNYIIQRIDKSLLNIFEVGFCPDHNLLKDFLKNKGFSDNDIKGVDLFIKNNKGDYFGRFTNRITFPIFNYENKIVGFGGRTINNSKIKYINSQESNIFKKSNILYGLKQNSEYIRKYKEVFLVEGYLDVIKLHERAIKFAVSTLGTTMSENQLKKLWMYVNTPYICFDGDIAGVSASQKIAIKSLSILSPGKSLKFLMLPDKQDPDQFITKNTKESFLDLKKKSLNLSDVIWNVILEGLDDYTPEFPASIESKITFYVSKISNKEVAAEYNKFLKSKKDKFIWEKNRNTNSSAKINLSKKIKVIDNLNEKIFIMILIYDRKILLKSFEEISNIKLNNKELESKRLKIIQTFSESNFQLEEPNSFEVLFEEDFNLEINELKITHLDNINDEERELFFKNIINNIRLPLLLEEREIIKKEILLNENSELPESLLLKYKNLNNEIQNIQNKKIE